MSPWIAVLLMPAVAYLALVGAVFSFRLGGNVNEDENPFKIALAVLCFLASVMLGILGIAALGASAGL